MTNQLKKQIKKTCANWKKISWQKDWIQALLITRHNNLQAIFKRPVIFVLEHQLSKGRSVQHKEANVNVSSNTV